MYSMRTKAPRTYLSPTREEMREAAKKCEVKKFSADLVEDFCNLAAGGEILPASEFRSAVECQAEEKLPSPEKGSDGKLYWKKGDGNWAENRQDAIADRVGRGMKYQQSVCDFLRTVELDKFPGDSPLEQAMNLLKLLSTQQGGQGGGEDWETLPIFTDNDRPEDVSEKLNDLMDTVESLSDAEKELLEETDESSGAEENGDDGLQKMKLAEDMAKGKDVWLKVSRQLDKLVRMKVAKSVKVFPDPAGDEVRTRAIAHLGEINRLVKSEWALPSVLRNFRLVTRAAQVRERVEREEKKQLLYIIVDCSGSMKDGQRVAKAGGVLFNRLKAVVAGEAELYVRFFDSRLHKEHYASNAVEAKALMKVITEGNFSGGSTNISGCAREAQKRIEEIVATTKTARPELVIVTDGDDSINLTLEELKGTKLHAFVVEHGNKALTGLAIKSGGVGIDL